MIGLSLPSPIPASIISRAMPRSSETSGVRGVMPMTWRYGEGPGSRSMMLQRAPYRASSLAMVKPTGPAPTTRMPAMAVLRNGGRIVTLN
jgi:hypothetical protein